MKISINIIFHRNKMRCSLTKYYNIYLMNKMIETNHFKINRAEPKQKPQNKTSQIMRQSRIIYRTFTIYFNVTVHNIGAWCFIGTLLQVIIMVSCPCQSVQVVVFQVHYRTILSIVRSTSQSFVKKVNVLVNKSLNRLVYHLDYSFFFRTHQA